MMVHKILRYTGLIKYTIFCDIRLKTYSYTIRLQQILQMCIKGHGAVSQICPELQEKSIQGRNSFMACDQPLD